MIQLLRICWLHIHDANPWGNWVQWTHWHVWETSRRWSELWHGTLFCWKQPWEDGFTVVIKNEHGQQLWYLKDAQLLLRGPKSTKKTSHTSLHRQHWIVDTDKMGPCFHVVYTKCRNRLIRLNIFSIIVHFFLGYNKWLFTLLPGVNHEGHCLFYN